MTGYVHEMIDKQQDFPAFAMNCAHAFGACYDMRDSNSKEIPEFKVSDVYQTRIDDALSEAASLESMSMDDRRKWASKKINAAIERNRESMRQDQSERNRLLGMQRDISEWHPPTKDHEGLKRFMSEQIETSLKYSDDSYCQKAIDEYEKTSFTAFFDKALADAREVHARAVADMAKEQERVARNNKWVRDLRESLGVPCQQP